MVVLQDQESNGKQEDLNIKQELPFDKSKLFSQMNDIFAKDTQEVLRRKTLKEKEVKKKIKEEFSKKPKRAKDDSKTVPTRLKMDPINFKVEKVDSLTDLKLEVKPVLAPTPSIVEKLGITQKSDVTIQPALTTRPAVTSQPVLTPQPVLAPQPAVTLQQVLAPQPVLTPQPVLNPQPVLTPQPVITPKPVLTHQVVSVPKIVLESQVSSTPSLFPVGETKLKSESELTDDDDPPPVLEKQIDLPDLKPVLDSKDQIMAQIPISDSETKLVLSEPSQTVSNIPQEETENNSELTKSLRKVRLAKKSPVKQVREKVETPVPALIPISDPPVVKPVGMSRTRSFLSQMGTEVFDFTDDEDIPLSTLDLDALTQSEHSTPNLLVTGSVLDASPLEISIPDPRPGSSSTLTPRNKSPHKRFEVSPTILSQQDAIAAVMAVHSGPGGFPLMKLNGEMMSDDTDTSMGRSGVEKTKLGKRRKRRLMESDGGENNS